MFSEFAPKCWSWDNLLEVYKGYSVYVCNGETGDMHAV